MTIIIPGAPVPASRARVVNVLALDASTTVLGLAVFNGTRLGGHAAMKHRGTIDERLKGTAYIIMGLVKTHAIDVIACEVPAKGGAWAGGEGRFRKATPGLWRVFGVVEATAYAMGCQFIPVEVRSWRAMCGIKARKRKDAKAAAMAWAKQVYGVDAKEDAAEAIGVGHRVVSLLKQKSMVEERKGKTQ